MGISSYQLSNLAVVRERRLKATLLFLLVWGIVSWLHWQPQTQWFMVGLTAILTIQTVRMLIAKPTFFKTEGDANLPIVSILIPAKNESAVLTNLAHNLFGLNYPITHLDIWVIDDGSTVTDDLDLTFRLYLIGAEIEFFTWLAVEEEGVTTWKNLWYQRCRWAEGGYQRYLDYFPQILTLGWQKKIDLLLFFILQFLIPIAIIPDLIWTIFYRDHPVILPLQILLGILLTVGFMAGVNQFQGLRGWRLIWATIQGSIYMVHWIPVMVMVTLRMCIKGGVSEWGKTEHHGRIRS
jgi:cellulose synthase/poly-beta-1,6-N-acetylglucosamine synthase-like glycosyltransferase